MAPQTVRRGTFIIAHTALANHSVRAAMPTYTVPKGFGGRVYKIQFMTYGGVVDTTVKSGGLIECENGSIDWKPFRFYSPAQELLTTTGGEISPYNIDCSLPLPETSVVTVYYTARNAATDIAYVTFYVDYSGSQQGGAGQTWMDNAVGAAITVITKVSPHVTFTAIAATKGGKLKKIFCDVMGTPETAVMEGGRVDVYASVPWGLPISFATASMFGKTTMAGVHEVVGIEADVDLPDNAIVYADYTPNDNQSQFLEMSIMWTK